MAIVVGPDGMVSVAGLKIPAPLVPRIIESLRGTYATLTDGKADEDVVRVVLKFWISQTLSQYEMGEALAPVDGAVKDTRKHYSDAAELARQKALADAENIVEAEDPVTSTS